jgi:hypothetical protein
MVRVGVDTAPAIAAFGQFTGGMVKCSDNAHPDKPDTACQECQGVSGQNAKSQASEQRPP